MSNDAGTALTGKRLLLVEDDFLVATGLARVLAARGAEILGPVASGADACALAQGEERIDAAVLDVALKDGDSIPIARLLQSRDCPFVFLTGFQSTDVLPDDLSGSRCLKKPVDPETLIQVIVEMS